MYGTLVVQAKESIECDNCGGTIKEGEPVVIDIHLIDGSYFFCSLECIASEHGEVLTDEEERRKELLSEYNIGCKCDEVCQTCQAWTRIDLKIGTCCGHVKAEETNCTHSCPAYIRGDVKLEDFFEKNSY